MLWKLCVYTSSFFYMSHIENSNCKIAYTICTVLQSTVTRRIHFLKFPGFRPRKIQSAIAQQQNLWKVLEFLEITRLWKSVGFSYIKSKPSNYFGYKLFKKSLSFVFSKERLAIFSLQTLILDVWILSSSSSQLIPYRVLWLLNSKLCPKRFILCYWTYATHYIIPLLFVPHSLTTTTTQLNTPC